jgi:CHASE2 domain-containing sensor protein
MKRSTGFALAGLSAILIVALSLTPVIQNVESSMYRVYMGWSIGHKTASKDIVLITVDQATVKAIGSK